MVNTKSVSQVFLCLMTMLASMFVSLSCPSRLSSPSLTIPSVVSTATPPSRIIFSLTRLANAFCHTLARAIACFPPYSIWLAIKLFITYRTSKIFAQASFRSWGRGSTLQTTKLLMSVSAIIGKFLATISTNYHPHSYIINHKGEYVKSFRFPARGIL